MNRIPTRTAWTPLRAAVAVALGASLASLAAVSNSQADATPKRAIARQGQALPTTSLRAQADEAFRSQRYAEAYGRYAALADDGDAASAGMALMLVSNGPTLFGSPWSATPGQLRRWSTLTTRDATRLGAQLADQDRGE